MATLLEIKPYIYNYIVENLGTAFADKVYWDGERVKVPDYPYCFLYVLAENKDRRTSHKEGDLVPAEESGEEEHREELITRYKTATITISIYNGWMGDTSDTEDMDVTKDWTYEQIDLLEGIFEYYPENDIFSVQNIGAIRALHEPMSGGYLYRYEFDLTVGYDEQITVQIPIGKKVNVDINKTYDHDSEGADNIIAFEVDSTMNTVSGRIYDKI